MLIAQNITITQYDLGDQLDDASLHQFAEDGEGNVYMRYSYFDSGVRNQRLVRFDGADWEHINVPCDRCLNHLLEGADGELYAAGEELGVIRYVSSSDSWETVVDQEAQWLAVTSVGNLLFVGDTGLFEYDGTTTTALNNANFPMLNLINDGVIDRQDRLYLRSGPNLYRHDSDGWTQLTDIVSPIHLAADPEGKIYISDNFGGVASYDGDTFNEDELSGVFPSFFGLKELVISSDGVFWAATQGTDPGLIRHEVGGTTASIPIADLVPEGILLNALYVAKNNSVFTTSEFNTVVAKVDDATVTSTDLILAPASTLQIAPNPTSDLARISWEAMNIGVGMVRVYLPSGELLQENIVDFGRQSRLDCSLVNYPAGPYLVVLHTEKGSQKTWLIKQ